MDNPPAWFRMVVRVQGQIVLLRYSHITDVNLSYSVALSGYLDCYQLMCVPTITMKNGIQNSHQTGCGGCGVGERKY